MLRSVAIGAVLLLVAACGSRSASTSPVSTTSPASAASAPDLSNELLALTDMPAGWSTATSQSSTSSPDCLKPLHDHTGSTGHASVDFNGAASGVPSLSETLAYYPGAGPATLARFDQAIRSCGTITVPANGQSLSGTIGAMSFPTLGDESHAYQVALSYKGIVVGLDVVMARRGDTLMSLVYADVGTPNVAQVEMVAAEAAAKLHQ